MSRRVLLFLALAILLIAGAATALVVTARPDLDDRRDTVDARWATVREPLATRYEGLRRLSEALAAAGAGDRTYAVDLADELRTWDAAAGRDDPDPAAQAASANRLEGLAARARINVTRSARLSRDGAIGEAFSGYDAALVPTADVEAYNRAVRRYQSARTGTLTGVVADLFGYDARPVLVVGVSAPSSE